MRDVLLEELDREDRAAPLAILNDAIQDFPGLEDVGPSFIDPAAPLRNQAAMFLDALMSTHWTAATALARSFLDEGLSLTDLHAHVIQPALREIGRLWQTRRIGVEHEHTATAITLGVLAQLRLEHPTPTPDAPVLVAACVEGELHDIGLRMVVDRYEREGCHVLYLGANTPIGAVVTAVAESRARTLALSATMTPHINQVARTIEALRADTRTRPTNVIVGGLPFIIAPDIWHKIGADASATDVESVPLGCLQGFAAVSPPGHRCEARNPRLNPSSDLVATPQDLSSGAEP